MMHDDTMLLNLQMILDPMDDLLWEYHARLDGDTAIFRSCLIFCGQSKLSSDVLYLVPEEWISQFPIHQHPYVTTADLEGKAPHICGIQKSFTEVANLVLATFQRYREFEAELNRIITRSGDLTSLCCVASVFFQNPVYIHDDMFSVLAASHRVDGMLDFEYNERSGKINVPLWLINEFKFDVGYQQTLTYRHAAIWGNDQYPYNIRTLFVNLWDGEYYYGRVMINELRTPLQPGHFRAAEYLAQYVILTLRQLEQRQVSHRNFEETLIGLISGNDIDRQDLRTMLNILDWSEHDPYMCLLLQEQNTEVSVHSSGAWHNLMSSLKGCISFHHNQQIHILINLAKTDLAPQDIRKHLAPHIRDSCMYGGISNPVDGIASIRTGFAQAAVALNYIKEEDSSNWFVSFSSCALSYIRECACHTFSPTMVVHPAILDLRHWDEINGTQYYETFRTYLFCERDIPQTSQALIIHRTTLTYRLGKILELTNLNLDDHNLRLYLLLSFHIMDHASSDKRP